MARYRAGGSENAEESLEELQCVRKTVKPGKLQGAKEKVRESAEGDEGQEGGIGSGGETRTWGLERKQERRA